MHVEISLTLQPLPAATASAAERAGAVGAVVEFLGVVRAEEDGRPIAALEYEAYAPMAERTMRRLVEELGRRHACLAVQVTHRLGIVPVGEAAVRVTAQARHRAAALAMVGEFLDRLKQDVPIWKRRALPALALEASP